MSWYGVFVVISLIVVGGGWIAYWLWNRKLDREEAQQPKQYSEQRKKTHSEVSDWARKMKDFKSPVPPKKPANDEKTQNE